MKRAAGSVVAAALALGLSSAPATADVLYSTDFDAFNPGPVNAQDGWTGAATITSSTTGQAMTLTTSAGATSPAIDPAGKTAASQYLAFSLDLTLGADMNSGSKFDIKVVDENGGLDGLLRIAREDVGFKASYFWRDEHGANGAPLVFANLPVSQPIAIEFVANFVDGGQDVVTLTVNGNEQVASTLNAGLDVDRVQFTSVSGSGTAQVDSFTIASAVPTPSTFALAGLTTFGGIVRRRR